jgi:hypothetical protein
MPALGKMIQESLSYFFDLHGSLNKAAKLAEATS